MPRIEAWSYSRWNTYEQCPFKAKCLYIDKLPEPEAAPLVRGKKVHEDIEAWLLGRVKDAPPEIEKLKEQYEALKKQKPLCELELAFDKDWKPVDWFSKGAWCRIKIDALVPPRLGVRGKNPKAYIVDHKTGSVDKRTGRLKELKAAEYQPQLELYALGAFLKYETAQEAVTELYFVDAGETRGGEHVFFQHGRNDLIALWQQRVAPMLADEQFAVRPGDYCKFCHFRRGNGGPCPY